MATDLVLVLTTVPDAITARDIADVLVGDGLAACVTALPAAMSTYRWQGAVERADEIPLIIKTTRERLDALTEALRSRHPHEVPEILALPVETGLPAYLDWVAAATRHGR
jgi:periplasmic divalent cation tolerance protein